MPAGRIFDMAKKRFFAIATGLVLACGGLQGQQRADVTIGTFANPVIAADWPDPAIWQGGDGWYYSVATGLRTIRRSRNLTEWEDSYIDPLAPLARQRLYQVSRNVWAPCVTKLGGKWVLYISLFVSDPDCRIAALVSDAPTGPFEFRGEVIDSRREGVWNAIDPYVLAVDGHVWMFFGSLADGIHRIELAADGLSVKDGAKPVHVAGVRHPADKMKRAWEGSYLHHRNGWWYLFVSGGHYGDHTYYLTVGRSRTIDGEFRDREGNPMTDGLAAPILSSGKDDFFYGPGHNGEIFTLPDGRDFIFYHSHAKGFRPNERPTLLQELLWTADGWPYFKDGRPQRTNIATPLSLWNDTAPAKAALIDYVQSVTRAGSADFIPPKNRIAVFDLDGTLMLETAPTYFDWLLFEHRVLDDPSYHATEEQLTAAHKSRDEGIMPPLTPNRERLVALAYKGMTLAEFDAYVRRFMDEPQPGFRGMTRGEAFYKPMVEVVRYLSDNGFTVYVSSGTDRLAVRPLVERNLGLPFTQIMGSDSLIVARGQHDTHGLHYLFNGDEELVLGGESLVKNLQMNKVALLAQELGARPVLAFGNSMTDASMVNYTIRGNTYKALGFMLCCDDLTREYGNAAKAEKMKAACRKNGWIPISMRDDWKTIYGGDVKRTSLRDML